MQFYSAGVIVVTIVCLSLLSNFCQVSAHIHLAVPENVRKMAFILHEHCVRETSVDEDWTLQMLRGSMPEDRSYGCYLHCIFNTIGLVAEDGTIMLEQILHLIPEVHKEMLEGAIQNCQTIRE